MFSHADDVPIIVPVHNLGAGGNTPPFWLSPPKGLGWRHVMFNAFYLNNGHSKVDVSPSIYAWVDSGGFLYIQDSSRDLAGTHKGHNNSTPTPSRTPDDENLVEEILRKQERFGADIAFTLDYPLEPNLSLDDIRYRITITARNAGLAYQLQTKSSMKIYVVLHYTNPNELDYAMKLLEKELLSRARIRIDEVDGFAIGGLVPYRSRLDIVVKRIIWLRKRIPKNKPIHVMGIASPLNIPILYAAGATSMDSKTFIISSAKRLWYIPLEHYLAGAPARIEVKKHRDLKPRKYCQCPMCIAKNNLEELARDTKALTLHNLYVLLDSRSKTKENTIKILKLLAKRYNRAKKAIEVAIENLNKG